jgi:hypothetical protein
MAVDASALWVSSLSGTGLAIVASSIVLGIISLIIVLLRAFVRFRENVFGWDDGLMVGGLVSLNTYRPFRALCLKGNTWLRFLATILTVV